MDFFEQLEWSKWKTLNDFEKTTLFEQVQGDSLPPTCRVTIPKLVTFELYGINCRTFEFEIDGELFVFIPGDPEAILGWSVGAEGLRYHELLSADRQHVLNDTFATSLTLDELQSLEIEREEEVPLSLNSLEEIDEYINELVSYVKQLFLQWWFKNVPYLQGLNF